MSKLNHNVIIVNKIIWYLWGWHKHVNRLDVSTFSRNLGLVWTTFFKNSFYPKLNFNKIIFILKSIFLFYFNHLFFKKLLLQNLFYEKVEPKRAQLPIPWEDGVELMGVSLHFLLDFLFLLDWVYSSLNNAN